jgi:hypothetical protein
LTVYVRICGVRDRTQTGTLANVCVYTHTHKPTPKFKHWTWLCQRKGGGSYAGASNSGSQMSSCQIEVLSVEMGGSVGIVRLRTKGHGVCCLLVEMGSSVGIVRLRTKGHGVCCLLVEMFLFLLFFTIDMCSLVDTTLLSTPRAKYTDRSTANCGQRSGS